jgi:hypothetical protein
MRPEGQPPSDRIMRGFLSCLRHRGGGATNRIGPTALVTNATFADAVQDSSSRDHESSKRCCGQRPVLLRKAEWR